MKILLLALFPLMLSAQVAGPSTQNRLDALRAAYAAAFQKEVGAVHEKAVTDLNAKYVAALDRALAAASQAGQLDTAVALRDEKKRLSEGGPLPADDFSAPETLKTLRLTYRSALTNLETQRDQLAVPVKTQYDQALEALQTELTKAGDLDGAIAIRNAREGLKTENASAFPTPAQIAKEEPVKTPMRAPTSKPSAADPEAALTLARWAFACQRPISILKEGEAKPVEIKAEGDLPKEPWSLYGINAGTANPEAPELFPWELVPQVPSLRWLGVNQKQPLTAEHSRHLSPLTKLTKLDISNMHFTLAGLEALPTFERMEHLKLGKYGGDVAAVMKRVGEKFPGLPILEVSFPIPVELLPGPKDPLASLREISISGPITPEIVAKLVKLPLLKSFDSRDCREDTLPPDLLLPFKDFRHLKFRRCKALTDLLPSLEKFSNLDLLLIQLGSSATLAPEALETLAKVKTRRFDLDGGLDKAVGDEHVEALSMMKEVKEMRLALHRITPDGMDRLQKALPRCKITY